MSSVKLVVKNIIFNHVNGVFPWASQICQKYKTLYLNICKIFTLV